MIGEMGAGEREWELERVGEGVSGRRTDRKIDSRNADSVAVTDTDTDRVNEIKRERGRERERRTEK